MRIINNNLGIQVNEKSRNEGANGNVNQKLVDLLLNSDRGSMVLEGQLLAKLDGAIKLALPKVGVVEVPLKQGTALSEGSQISVKLTLSEGELSAEILPQSDESADVPKSKVSEQLLSKLNLPLTKSNQEAADLLIQYKIEPSADKVKQLAEGSFLASKINEQIDQPEMDQTLSRLVKSLELQDVEMNKSESLPALSLKKIVLDLVQGADPSFGSTQPNEELEDFTLTKENGKILKDQNIKASNNLPSESTEAETPVEVSVKAIKQALLGLDAKKILALMSLGEKLEVDQLQRMKKTFGSDEGQIHLKHKLLDQLRELMHAKTPSHAFKNGLEAWLNDSGNKMDVRALNSLEALLKESEPQLYGAMKESIEVVRTMGTMIEQLPQQVYGLHVPVLINEQESQLEIYVNRKKSRRSNDGFKMLLALQTESFEQVQILVSDYQQKLTVEFKVSDEKTLKIFESEMDALKTELKQITTQSVDVSVGLKFEEPIVLTVLGFMGKDGSSQIDARI